MSALGFHGVVAALLLAALPAVAQDCPTAPLLGRRAAVSASVAHAASGQSRLGGTLLVRAAGPVRIGAGYGTTRFENIDRLTYDASFDIATAFSGVGLTFCPALGGAFARLAHDPATGLRGQVDTRSGWAGMSIGHAFGMTAGSRMTPFIQPVHIRRHIAWESIDAGGWRVYREDHEWETQLSLGLSLATTRLAVVGRFRPDIEGSGRSFDVAITTAFGTHNATR